MKSVNSSKISFFQRGPSYGHGWLDSLLGIFRSADARGRRKENVRKPPVAGIYRESLAENESSAATMSMHVRLNFHNV